MFLGAWSIANGIFFVLFSLLNYDGNDSIVTALGSSSFVFLFCFFFKFFYGMASRQNAGLLQLRPTGQGGVGKGMPLIGRWSEPMREPNCDSPVAAGRVTVGRRVAAASIACRNKRNQKKSTKPIHETVKKERKKEREKERNEEDGRRTPRPMEQHEMRTRP